MPSEFNALVDAATRPYADAGRYAYHFTRGKLRRDPVFRALLQGGLLPDQGQLLDLGCGLGVLPAMLLEARNQYRVGNWPSDWPAPPQKLYLHGVELLKWKVAIANTALGDKASIQQGDIRTADFPPCSDVIIILDVLMYMQPTEQRLVLQRVAQSLPAGGVLLLREANAAGGWRFHATRMAEQILSLLRGQGWPSLHYRSETEWITLLEELGFSVKCLPMSQGTPFANVLFRAKRVA